MVTLLSLPDETISHILEYLTIDEMTLTILPVSHGLRSLVQSSIHWRAPRFPLYWKVGNVVALVKQPWVSNTIVELDVSADSLDVTPTSSYKSVCFLSQLSNDMTFSSLQKLALGKLHSYKGLIRLHKVYPNLKHLSLTTNGYGFYAEATGVALKKLKKRIPNLKVKFSKFFGRLVSEMLDDPALYDLRELQVNYEDDVDVKFGRRTLDEVVQVGAQVERLVIELYPYSIPEIVPFFECCGATLTEIQAKLSKTQAFIVIPELCPFIRRYTLVLENVPEQERTITDSNAVALQHIRDLFIKTNQTLSLQELFVVLKASSNTEILHINTLCDFSDTTEKEMKEVCAERSLQFECLKQLTVASMFSHDIVAAKVIQSLAPSTRLVSISVTLSETVANTLMRLPASTWSELSTCNLTVTDLPFETIDKVLLHLKTSSWLLHDLELTDHGRKLNQSTNAERVFETWLTKAHPLTSVAFSGLTNLCISGNPLLVTSSVDIEFVKSLRNACPLLEKLSLPRITINETSRAESDDFKAFLFLSLSDICIQARNMHYHNYSKNQLSLTKCEVREMLMQAHGRWINHCKFRRDHFDEAAPFQVHATFLPLKFRPCLQLPLTPRKTRSEADSSVNHRWTSLDGTAITLL